MARARGKPRPRKPNATGRTDKSGKFVMLPHRILSSTAYASLDLTARGLLQELVMIYNGGNNGSLWLSVRDATDRLGLSDYRPALRAFEDLQERGFVTLAKDSHFEVKAAETSRARCWRITWHTWPECPTWSKRSPTDDWMGYAIGGKSRESSRADKRLRALDRHRRGMSAGRFPVVDSATLEAEMSGSVSRPVVESTTVDPAERRKPPSTVVGDSRTHVDWTMDNGSCGWWSSSVEAHLWAQMAFFFAATQKPDLVRSLQVRAVPPMGGLHLQ